MNSLGENMEVLSTDPQSLSTTRSAPKKKSDHDV